MSKSGITFQPKPEGNHYVTIHLAYKLITDGNAATAALLSVFEWMAEATLARCPDWQPGQPIPDVIKIDGHCSNSLLMSTLDGLIKESSLKTKIKKLVKLGFIGVEIISGRYRHVWYNYAEIARALSKPGLCLKGSKNDGSKNDGSKNGPKGSTVDGKGSKNDALRGQKLPATIPITIPVSNPTTKDPPLTPQKGGTLREPSLNLIGNDAQTVEASMKAMSIHEPESTEPVNSAQSSQAESTGSEPRAQSSAEAGRGKKKTKPSTLKAQTARAMSDRNQFDPDFEARTDRMWAKWSPFYIQLTGDRDDKQGFRQGYSWLISGYGDQTESPDNVEAGLNYYVDNKLAQFQAGANPFRPPGALRFFRGKRPDHPTSYCLNSLELKREREAGETDIKPTNRQGLLKRLATEQKRLNLTAEIHPDWVPVVEHQQLLASQLCDRNLGSYVEFLESKTPETAVYAPIPQGWKPITYQGTGYQNDLNLGLNQLKDQILELQQAVLGHSNDYCDCWGPGEATSCQVSQLGHAELMHYQSYLNNLRLVEVAA